MAIPDAGHTYSTRQTLIWKVPRLIELSRDLPVQEVYLEDLPVWEPEMDGWGIRGLDDFVGNMQRVLDADLSYPIILSAEGWVMDGMHRIAKAKLQGFTTIKAVRFPVNPLPDSVRTDLEPETVSSL